MADTYVIEVSLRDVRPRIWRRFAINRQAYFIDLHEAIQGACGWKNCHKFQFKDTRRHMLAGLPDGPDDVTTPDAFINPISKSFGSKKGKKILYVYDLGEQWVHEVELVEVEKATPVEFGRHLLAGERAFPPEDCGGLGGYEECVAVAKGKHKDGERRRSLKGWHPEKFDLKKAVVLFDQAKLSLRSHYRGPTLI